MSVRDELLELERAFWAAGGNGDFYRQHLDDEGVCVFSMGIMGKEQTVEAIEQGEPWGEVSFDDIVVVPLAQDAAGLAYTARARRLTTDVLYEARVSSVYTRRSGSWHLARHQQTPVG